MSGLLADPPPACSCLLFLCNAPALPCFPMPWNGAILWELGIILWTQHASLLVLHAELLTMRGDGVGYVRGGALAVAEGGAILAVGTAEELRGRFTATSTLDASGCVVMPGLVDARMRSRDAVQRAAGLSKVAAERSHAAVLAGARLAALEGLKAGTTLFCDVGSPFLGWAETYERAGARACLALELCADGQGGAQHARAQLAQAASFARQYHGAAGRRVLCQLAPAHATALPDEVLREADAIAKRLGTSLHVPLAEGPSHAHEKQQFASQGRQSAARHRHTGSAVFAAASSSSDVERLDGAGVLSPRMLAAHLTHCSVEEAATVAFKCGRMVCVPTSATLRAGRAGPVREFRAAGGACGLGTGSAAEGCSHSLWGEARAAALAAKLSARDGAELPASDALRMATVEGARALGVGAAVGALDVGMQVRQCAKLHDGV